MFKIHNRYHVLVPYVMYSTFTAFGFILNFITKHQPSLFFTVVLKAYLTSFNSSLYRLLYFKAITFHDLTKYIDLLPISVNIF